MTAKFEMRERDRKGDPRMAKEVLRLFAGKGTLCWEWCRGVLGAGFAVLS